MTDKSLKIDCTQCQHYYVTWDENRPHGCRFFAFKYPYSPSLAVYESSGKPCEAFLQKDFSSKKPSTIDAKNDKKSDKKNEWIA